MNPNRPLTKQEQDLINNWRDPRGLDGVWTPDTDTIVAECHICGHQVSTADVPSKDAMEYCGDCGKPTCGDHREDGAAARCTECQEVRLDEGQAKRKQRLEEERLAYRRKIRDWAHMVDLLSYTEGQDGMTTDEALALQIAAQVLRNAKSAQVKRAHTEVRQARKGTK
jgi:hypothetical protein